MNACPGGGLFHLGIARSGPPQADVLSDTVAEEEDILGDNRKQPAQLRQGIAAQLFSSQQYPSRLRIPEAQQEADHSALSRPAHSHQSHGRASRYLEAEGAYDPRLLGSIAEAHILKGYGWLYGLNRPRL